MLHKILVIGGSGFIGRHLIARLVEQGHQITVPTRRRDRARHLWLHPKLDVIEADVHSPDALARLVAGQTAVINLVGVLHSKPGTPYGPAFAKNHVELVRKIIQAMQQAGVKRLLHMSALGASAQGPSMYSRSKAAGEALVRDSGLDWTIFQPSVVFGPEDQFLNTFAKLAKIAPVFPLAGSGARLQPVYVQDVAQTFVTALHDRATIGQSYQLAGPTVYTLAELVRFAAAVGAHRNIPVLPLPLGMGKLQALAMELAPGPTLMSRDNVDSLKADNVATEDGLARLGIHAQAMEPIATQYLQGKHPRTRSDAWRVRAHR
ncbi:MAG TPA: complex I NDUFA9 subunit family protein [Burkholderiaceae bacterium]|nr:complex I NDUFA9 subunit family protein [Burkholderiaceae bacterium]